MNTIFQKALYLKIFIVAIHLTMYSQDPKEIIRKSEEVRRGVTSSYAEMTMEIIRPEWSREMSLKSWSKGEDYALILVTAPARDKGTANLKRKQEVWSWVPRIERTIKLPPSMMSQSWMGSDFKNEDLVRENSLVNDYTHTLIGNDTIRDRSCYVIELIPKPDAAVVWGKVILWIDQQDYLQLKAEFYDEEQNLINTMQSSAIKPMDGKPFATRLEMIPEDEKGHKTVLTYQEIEFDKKIPDDFFTVQNMKRVR